MIYEYFCDMVILVHGHEQNEDEVVPVHNVKACGDMEVGIHSFLTSAIGGYEKLSSLAEPSTLQNSDHRLSINLAGKDPHCLDAFGKKKKELYCPYRESNNVPWLSSPQPKH